jgi:hypothetical protein
MLSLLDSPIAKLLNYEIFAQRSAGLTVDLKTHDPYTQHILQQRDP